MTAPMRSYEGRRSAGLTLFAAQMRLDEAETERRMISQLGDAFAEDTWQVAATAWIGDELSPRDRSLAVVASLIAQGGLESRLSDHLGRARDNGLTRPELEALVRTLAVYIGYPKASVAMEVVRGMPE